MKTIKYTITWIAIIFTGLTLLTMKNEASFDGKDAYGFPFTFYDKFEGKCEPSCYELYGFHFFYLLADLGLVAIVAYAGVWLTRKLVSKRRSISATRME